MTKKTNLSPTASRARLARIAPLLLAAIALIAASSLMARARAWLRPAAATVSEAAAPPSSTASISAQPLAASPSGAKRKALEAEIITIRPNGFEPDELSRPKGRFILMVDNRSGIADVELQLDRETGARLHQVSVPSDEQDWNDEFDLPPGQYVLREAGHPEWSCRITITAQ